MSDSAALPFSCPQCGTALPAGATEGLCPQCLATQPTQAAPAGTAAMAEFDAPTVVVTRPRPTLSGSQQPELPLPEELTALLPPGNYQVVDFLGAGGMGAVYKGVQVRLKRPVAIKIMRRDLGKDHDFEQRFEREAQAMAKLNHPNIVTVIDFGEAGPDYLYIAMELVDGADLMHLIRGGHMTQEMALALLPQICDALQFAHDHGIAHRDIKPSNIMLTRAGQVKMADFGLAKHFDAEDSFRTQTGTGMGTPDYAAPEQFDPTTSIDHRADIYALGVMIYQMITGQLPRGAWKPPSQRAEVSPQWDGIVSRAMQSDPGDRYQQASEVKTAVSSMVPPVAGAAAGSHAAPAPPVHSPAKGGAAAKDHAAGRAAPAAPDKATGKTPLLLGILTGVVILSAGAFLALRPSLPKSAGLPPPSQAAATTPGSPPPPSAVSVSIPGLPSLPPLTLPPGEPGLVKELEIRGNYMNRFMILPDNRRLLAFPDGSVTLIDLESGKPLWTAPADAPFSVALNQDGSRFATYDLLDESGKKLGSHQGARQAKITLRQSSDGRIIQTWMLPTTDQDKGYAHVALSPTGKTLVARVRGEGANTSTFVCLEEGKTEPVDRWVPQQHLGQSTHAWREDAFISSGEGGGGAVLMKRGGQIEALTPEMAQFHSAISPDGHWFAASDNGKLGLWDLRTRTFTRKLAESTLSARDISFAGNDLVVMGHSRAKLAKTFKVWDRATGRLAAVLPLTRPDEYTEGVMGAPNGAFAVLRVKHDPVPPGGETNLLQIWRLPRPGQVHASATAAPSGAAVASPAPIHRPGPSPSPSPSPGPQPSTSLPATAAVSSPPTSATQAAPFVNTLGMQFVPVPIIGGPTDQQRVLFSVWETRVRDYDVFAKETKRAWEAADYEQTPAHPAVRVSWDDAQAFCAWLTMREHQAGKLAPNDLYRLPADHEWSCAVGIGPQEDAAQPPSLKDQKLPDVYPWGTAWPPPPHAGNYWSEELRPLLAAGKFSYIMGQNPGYRDGHAAAAPVGSFTASPLGLHDLGGNVAEWCADGFDATRQTHVLRGASWVTYTKSTLLSSARLHYPPDFRHGGYGFRCVIAPAAK